MRIMRSIYDFKREEEEEKKCPCALVVAIILHHRPSSNSFLLIYGAVSMCHGGGDIPTFLKHFL